MKPVTKRKILLAIAEGDPHHFKAVEIASSLGVSRAWVSSEVKHLLDEGLFIEGKGKKLSLTEQGEKEMELAKEEYRKLSLAIAVEFSLSSAEAHRLARRLLEGTY
jgi:Mn-dependent transcriptional regulator